jgi:hypothetical protein
MSCSATSDPAPGGSRVARSCLAAARSSPPSRSSGIPGAVKVRISGSRTPKSIAMPSASRRRATKVIAAAEASSSQWASSITHSSGCSSATAASRLRAPPKAARRSRRRPRALADAGLAPDDERAAAPRSRRVEHVVDPRGLALAAKEHRGESVPPSQLRGLGISRARAHHSRVQHRLHGDEADHFRVAVPRARIVTRF